MGVVQKIAEKFSENSEELILRIELVVLIFFYLLLISVHFNVISQIILAYAVLGVTFLFSLFVKAYPEKKTPWLRTLFVLLGMFLSLRYMYWRVTVSLAYAGVFDTIGMFMLFAAEVYSIFIYVIGVFSSLSPLERKVIDISGMAPVQLPSVDVFIPTYSEPIEMVANTAMAALSMNYPSDRFKVFILDDGGTDQKCNDSHPGKREEARQRRKEMMETAEEIGAIYITRPRNLHAKAGNLNEALQKTTGDLILILDCDHIPTRDFLQNTAGWFLEREDMFLVQTPHTFYNPDPVERNMHLFGMAPGENQMFYQHIQKGHDFWESSFFCGSAALLRRKYLEEIGGISGETITEDAETAITLHSKGYKSAFIAIPMVRGRNPDTFAGMVIQRIRWTQGMIQIFMLKNPFKIKGLKWYQRFSYLSASGFWFFAFSRVVFMLSPLFYLYFGLHIYRADGLDLLGYTIPHVIAASQVSNMLYCKVRWTLFSEMYETAISFFTLPAIIEIMIKPRDAQFKVTPKGEDVTKDFISHLVSPFVVMFILIIIGYFFAGYRWFNTPQERHIIAMTTAWNTFNLMLVMTGLAISSEKGEKRQYIRIPCNEHCQVGVGGLTFEGAIEDLSEGGVAIRLTDSDQGQEALLSSMPEAEISIIDEYNKVSDFKGTVLRYREGKLVIQFVGLAEDLRARRNLIALLYGSETKWINMDARKESPSSLGAIILLTRYSLKNVMFGEIFRHSFSSLWRRIRYGAS